MTVQIGQAEKVARMEMIVASAEPTPEAAERWERRAQTLARWLLAAWHREQEEGEAGDGEPASPPNGGPLPSARRRRSHREQMVTS